MLAKLTSKNQLTLPKSVTQPLGPVQYFEVHTEAGQIILTPVRIQRGDALRAKLAELEIDAKTIESALRWAGKTIETSARKKSSPSEKTLKASERAAAPKTRAKPLSASKAVAAKKTPAKTRKAVAPKTIETPKAASKARSTVRKAATSKPATARQVFARAAKAVKR